MNHQAVATTPSAVGAKVRYINAEWRNREDSPRIGSRESRRAMTSFQDVLVHDVRAEFQAGQIDLDRSGFTLRENLTECGDFRDDAVIEQRYYPEMIELIQGVSGADHVFVRAHLVRTEIPTDFNDGYARFVHCDYNIRLIEELAHELLARYDVEAKPNWSYAWYNTWQPFDHQVQKNPLAMIDWQSLPFEDVIDYYYTGRGLDSLTAAPVYSPDHRFCYFPEMETTETLVIKQLDARPGRAAYCPHTSFDLPGSDDALPRRSIETRLLAVFEDAA